MQERNITVSAGHYKLSINLVKIVQNEFPRIRRKYCNFPRLFSNATDSVLEYYATNSAFVLIISGTVNILNYKNYHTVKHQTKGCKRDNWL